jgi:hypothetical protein
MKRLTNGDVVASFVAALFLVANVNLVSDREQTAIGFIDIVLMILPSLVTFARGLETKSLKWTAASGLLFLLTYGAFPNYRITLLCGIALALTTIFLFMSRGLKANYALGSHRLLNIGIDVDLFRTYIKHMLTFVASSLLASLWLIALLITNLTGLFGLYQEMGAPLFVLNIQPHDVLRLIAKWSFYKGALGQPYVPYRDFYFSNPLIVTLSYIPPAIAFASLLTSRSRKLTIYFSVVALFSLLLTSGLNPYFSQLYFTLSTQIPLMLAFREPTNWIFLVVLSYSVLIGVAFSALYHRFKKEKFQLAALGFAVVLFLSTTYPMVTGDVTRNWLNPSIKGSYFPSSYEDLNNLLPSQYWALLLPKRATYVVYNFTEGVLACGNPYPLVFSKPIITGVGTEYVQSANLELVNKLHELMLTNENVASTGKISASSTEDTEFEPEKAVDGQFQTRWSSKKGVPQWLEVDWNQSQLISEINIVFEAAYAEDYRIETWNNTSWVTQTTVKNSTSYLFSYSFPHSVRTTRLRFYFTKTTEVFPSISIWELEIYARNPGISELLGVLGIKYLVLEKNITLGSTYDVNRLDLNESERFVLTREWDEVALYSNAFALQKLYVSDNTISYTSLEDFCKVAENSQWETLQHSVFVNSSSADPTMNNTLVLPDDFSWIEHSPTSYEAQTESRGAFMLVFLESYDPHWKLYVNDSLIPEESHVEVNAYANGWIIDDTGKLTIRVEYETQSLLTTSIVAAMVLVVLLFAFLSRRELRRITSMVRNRFERKSSKT